MRALDDVLKQDGELEALVALTERHPSKAGGGRRAACICTIADEPNISRRQ